MPKVVRMHFFMIATCFVGDEHGSGLCMFLLFSKLLVPRPDPRLLGWDEVLGWVAKYHAVRREKFLRLKAENEAKERAKAAEGDLAKAVVQAAVEAERGLGRLCLVGVTHGGLDGVPVA